MRAILRTRIAEPHYAGGLVDGARMLQLFGDVATELCIRVDGDEGLFRAYESVEFLAPVRAGDFIEAEGTVVRWGNTSIVIDFVARKVIGPASGAIVSAADVLPTPEIVCRARGTCVVPKAMRREGSLRHLKRSARAIGWLPGRA